MAPSSPRIAILSLGDMGTGIARLLIAYKHVVGTCTAGRSEHTIARAKAANVVCYDSDEDLVRESDIVVSIVPPRDAVATAQRVKKAWDVVGTDESKGGRKLWYLDLNAISPARAREVATTLGIGERECPWYFKASDSSASVPSHASESIVFLDGGIISGPPEVNENGNWTKPSIPISGPYPLSTYPEHGAALTELLAIRHISPIIGPATGLKMCFASLHKGFSALALQSFASAQSMGVLGELRRELAERAPAVGKRAEGAITHCPPKAYRWVGEMQEIAECFAVDGGWSNGADEPEKGGADFANIFAAVAQVFQVMADKTILGAERIGARQRGTTVEDVSEILADVLVGNKNKTTE